MVLQRPRESPRAAARTSDAIRRGDPLRVRVRRCAGYVTIAGVIVFCVTRPTIVPRWGGTRDDDFYPWFRAEFDDFDIDAVELVMSDTPGLEPTVAAVHERLGDGCVRRERDGGPNAEHLNRTREPEVLALVRDG